MDISFGKATIFNVNASGIGEGQSLDSQVSIPFTLPMETVDFECHSFKKRKKHFPREIHNPNPDRVPAVCKHFTQCGGCMLQHMGKNLYKDFKTKLVTDALISHGLDPFSLNGITILPFGKRRRANMDIVKKHDTLYLGFHRYQSHQIINVDECHTLDPAIVSILPDLRSALYNVLAEFEKAKVFFTLTHVGIDLSLEIQGIATLTSEQRDELITFAQKHQLARFVFRYRKTIDTLHMIARPTIMFAGIPIETDAYSFLQATDEADAFLEAFILANVHDDAKSILDLFCGRGTLSFPLSKKAPVVGYEFDKPALAALEKGAPFAAHSIVAHYRDLFEDPLSYAELTPFDTIVIDPPRAGAENQVRSIAKSHAKTVIYVSCNPETFARDAAILTQGDGAFSLEFVHALDQFAWSPHVEVLAVFKRKK